MAEMDLDVCPPDPLFITYLLSQDLTHDCYFIVTNKDLVKPVKIGVVKKMLLAHSVVLRNELEDSVIAEKGDVPMDDIYPDTFTNLLKYMYGFDNTAFLSFDEADNLLYTAEKYMMEPLKKKLSTRLISLLNTDNICSLLNNPACFKVIELNSLITEILQFETDKVLASSHFVNLSSDALLKIVEQEAMNVNEIDVWRAAIKWAENQTESPMPSSHISTEKCPKKGYRRHQAKSPLPSSHISTGKLLKKPHQLCKASDESGAILRKQLSKHMKHIRLCTLNYNDFCKEVLLTKILTYDELQLVCLSQSTGNKQAALTEISNEIKPRLIVNPKCEVVFSSHYNPINMTQSKIIINTKNISIQLLPLKLVANTSFTTVNGPTYQCNCTINITENTNNANTLSVVFNKQVKYGNPFEVPLVKDKRNVKLLPNKKYTLNVSFNIGHQMYSDNNGYYPYTYANDHLSVTFGQVYNSGQNVNISPVKSLAYRPIKFN